MDNPEAGAGAAAAVAVSGPGACCVEAQADGVPCSEIRDCEICGRAHPVALPPDRTAAVVPHLQG